MNDGAIIRCISIMGGVVLLVVCLATGMDGETKLIAGAMVGFGLGIPVGAMAEKLSLAEQVEELKELMGKK